MEFGVFLPMRGSLATTENILRLAQHAELLGYSVVGFPDHVVIPRTVSPHYPYSKDGEFHGVAVGDCLDPLIMMALVAGRTDRIRLLNSILVVPHRQAVITAKMLATIDIVSSGRLIVGCGAGWMREEFEAIGAPDFDRRGTVTNEYIHAFRDLWTKENPAFEGRYVQYKDIAFEPKPVQKPHPPIWTGGESAPALRRAARLADGWYPIGTNPTHPLDTLQSYADGIGQLHAIAEKNGRDPGEIDLAYCAQVWWGGIWGTAAEKNEPDAIAFDGSRRILTGTPEQVAADVDAMADLGCQMINLNFASPEIAKTMDRMEEFMMKVRPLIKA